MNRVDWVRHYLLTRGRTHRYGSDRSQLGDLHLPHGAGPHPVIVAIHGGSWRKQYGRAVMRAVAAALVRRGFAVWNIEYRRVGAGGGWPQTFEDVAAAIDLLDGLHPSLDVDRVDLLGHSAGGHLALWAAGCSELPPDAPGAPGASVSPLVQVRRVVSLAGVCDLAGAYREWNGGAVRALMGGSPERLPERYDVADPLRRVPLRMPALLVHGVRDETVSVRLSRAYAEAARAAGGEVELVEIEGDAGNHRAFIEPHGVAWEPVWRWLERAGDDVERSAAAPA
jgi:acetyl esterase/lipase